MPLCFPNKLLQICALTLFVFTSSTGYAQDDGEIPVRRALPVTPEDREGDIPILRAVPVNPLQTPAPDPQTPAPTPVVPAPTPLPPAPTPLPPAPAPLPPAPAQPSQTPTPAPTPTPTPMPAPQATPSAEPPREIRRAEPVPAPVTTPAPAPADPTPPLTPASPPRQSTPDAAMFNVANGFYSQKMFEMAVREFEDFLRTHPGSRLRDAAWFRLGESHRNLGEKGRARVAYETLLRETREGEFAGSAAYRLAELAVERGDYQAALNYFEQAGNTVSDPQVRLAANFREARSLEILRRRESARQAYRKILQSDVDPNPYREAALTASAQLSAETGRKREAVNYHMELLQDGSTPAVRAEAGVNAGLLLVELGDLEPATKAFSTVLEIPVDGDWQQIARVGLLRIDYDAGRYASVVKSYNAAAESFSEKLRPEAMLLAANSHRQLDQPGEAAKLYRAIAETYPDSPFAADAGFQQLVTLYTSGSPDLIPQINQFLDTTGSQTQADQARLLKAETLFRDGQFGPAADEYRQLIKSTLPEDRRAESLYKLGWCQLQNGDTDGALESFTDYLVAFEGKSHEATVLAQRGLTFQRVTRYEEALADFGTLIQNFKDAPEREVALQQKALILGQREDNAGMARTFSQLLKEYPETAAAAQANYWIGWVNFEAQRYREAIAPLTAARDLDREGYGERAGLRLILANYYIEDRDAVQAGIDEFVKGDYPVLVPGEILRWLGISFHQDGEPAKAVSYLTQLVERENPQPPPADVFLTLGRAHQETNNVEQTSKAIGKFLEMTTDPAHQADAILVRARAELEASQYTTAQASTEEALRLQPEGRINAEARILQAELSMAEKNYEEAAKAFERVAVLFRDPEISPRALEKAYRAWKLQGNATEADRVLNDLRTRFPEFPVSKVE